MFVVDVYRILVGSYVLAFNRLVVETSYGKQNKERIEFQCEQVRKPNNGSMSKLWT